MKQPELGQRVLELRSKKGLTQEELVNLCNINVRTLQRIENGEVTPRSYTIKTILSALDYDYESLQLEGEANVKPNKIAIAPENVKSVNLLLTVAWIAGVLFAITGIFEGIVDYVLLEEKTYYFGVWGYVTIKVLIVFFNGLLLYGFLIAGNLLKNHLMKISSILLFIVLLVFYVFEILSVFYEQLDIEVILIAQGVSFGVVGLLFGISILKSRPILGNTGLASGIIELVLAFCLLTIVLSPLALFFFFPAIILEVLILYKLSVMVKN